MHDPAGLPLEIFLIILHYVAGGNPDKLDYYDQFPSNLCLINRRWHAVAVPQLYSRVENHGEPWLKRSLWRFLRTVISNAELAALVRTVDFPQKYTYQGKDKDRFKEAERLYSENREIVQKAISQAGLEGSSSSLESEIHEGLQRDDQRPLIALILAHLPNLTTLQIHVQKSDPFLEAILFRAVGLSPDAQLDIGTGTVPTSRALQNLERAFLATWGHPIKHPDHIERIRAGYPLRIDQNRPFLYLPMLQELCLLDAELKDDLTHWIGSKKHTISSRLSQLTVVLDAAATASSLTNLWTLLKQHTTNLTSLSLNLPDPKQTSLVTIHRDLWSALEPLQATLEYLDIYQESSPSNSRAHSEELDFCCPLRKFTKLRTLSITPLLLRGNCSRHKAPLQLINHLPLDLNSLAIYNSDKDCGSVIEELEMQLETIPRHKYTRLTFIVVEVPVPWMGNRNKTLLPYRRMERWAKAKGITFKTSRDALLAYGGKDSWFGLWAHTVPQEARFAS
ncbi:hypothetical protein VTN00DRAFT_2009 [Thermoascus crustaceus]|uniref:uncharacterized protein n=1 Tax=Thermoascus crustaceus TaxID=5088 RepID=UPI00374328B6